MAGMAGMAGMAEMAGMAGMAGMVSLPFIIILSLKFNGKLNTILLGFSDDTIIQVGKIYCFTQTDNFHMLNMLPLPVSIQQG